MKRTKIQALRSKACIFVLSQRDVSASARSLKIRDGFISDLSIQRPAVEATQRWADAGLFVLQVRE
jgi:hypothetical protein